MTFMTAKRAFTAVNMVLTVAAVYLIVNTVYAVVGAGLDKAQVSDAAATRPLLAAREAYKPVSYYNPITERNLFHTTSEESQAAMALDLENMKETDLNLKLWGTVAGDSEYAYAVIEDTKLRSQGLYRTGDEVQSATVKMVLRGKVVLSINGEDEVLAMEESSGGSRVPMVAERVEDDRGHRRGRLIKSVEPRTQKINLKRSLIEESFSNATELMKQVSISPYSEDGKPGGFVLKSVKPDSIFRRMGLRSGDVVTGVNGDAIESVEDAMKLYENMKSESGLNLQIKRRGTDRTIEYNIDQK